MLHGTFGKILTPVGEKEPNRFYITVILCNHVVEIDQMEVIL